MGYGPTAAGTIRVNYEKYLYPYEIFLAKNGKMDVRVCVCAWGTKVEGIRIARASTAASSATISVTPIVHSVSHFGFLLVSSYYHFLPPPSVEALSEEGGVTLRGQAKSCKVQVRTTTEQEKGLQVGGV